MIFPWKCSIFNTLSIDKVTVSIPFFSFSRYQTKCQALIKKGKTHVNCEKGAQISILTNKIATQSWPNIIIKESKQTIHYIYTSFSHWYVHIMLLIFFVKKLELCLMVGSVLFKIKFGHAQIHAQVCPKSIYWCLKQPVLSRECVIKFLLRQLFMT